MHELSVAMSIVDIAREEVHKAGAKEVKEIALQIGDLAGIEFEALDFAWDLAVKGTVLEKAIRKIDHVRGLAYCPECDSEFELVNRLDPCPYCNNYLYHLIGGKELKIKSLIVN